jgi:hypothetical protein
VGACDLHVSPFVLTWNLYAGVPDMQGTDNGPGFRRVFQFSTRAGAGRIPLLGRNLVRILRFSVFSFFEKTE